MEAYDFSGLFDQQNLLTFFQNHFPFFFVLIFLIRWQANPCFLPADKRIVTACPLLMRLKVKKISYYGLYSYFF